MNRRADKMWEQIDQAVYFYPGAEVIDLGAGYGDLAIRAAGYGAHVTVVEQVPHVLSEGLGSVDNKFHITVKIDDIERYIKHHNEEYWYVAFCTSVLPYMSNPDAVLDWMSKHAKMSVIECQYAGDGPGFENILTDVDMTEWLEKHWAWVTKIGETVLDIRPASRSIWLCN